MLNVKIIKEIEKMNPELHELVKLITNFNRSEALHMKKL
jgi:hypothetical protein